MVTSCPSAAKNIHFVHHLLLDEGFLVIAMAVVLSDSAHILQVLSILRQALVDQFVLWA